MTVQMSTPFRAFTRLEQEMHELIDRMGARPWREGFGWRPDTDIYHADGKLVVEVELPGVEHRSDLSVGIEDNVLLISGMSRQSSDASDSECLVSERRFGPFHREVFLPDGCRPSGVTASFGNGVLVVRIACPEDAGAGEGPGPIRVVVIDGEAGAAAG